MRASKAAMELATFIIEREFYAPANSPQTARIAQIIDGHPMVSKLIVAAAYGAVHLNKSGYSQFHDPMPEIEKALVDWQPQEETEG